MKTFYTANFEGAAKAMKDSNRYADCQTILREIGVQRLRDIPLERQQDFVTVIKRLGFQVFDGGDHA